MKYHEQFTQTPNVSARKITPTGIILHHTAGSFLGSVRWCLKPESQVSYHCIVDTDGSRQVLAKDNQRAWHAGRSSFKGQSNCNDFMLGIAVSGDTSKRELTSYEIDSVAKWCVEKCKIHRIPITNITTHRAVSPGRKFDVDNRAEIAIMDRVRELLNLNC
jgi:N-acetyl-anhydromuramyl-L-alanine amidase AmpD